MPDPTELGVTRSEPSLVDASKKSSLSPPSPSAEATAAAAAVDHHRSESVAMSDGDLPPSPYSLPQSPSVLPRSDSFTGSSYAGSYQEDWEAFPPLERLSALDILGSFTLPAQIEKWQSTLAQHTERVKAQRRKLQESGRTAKERVVEEWRRRVPTADEQLDKYRRRVRTSVDRLGTRWSDTKAVSLREKLAFIAGVLNIFISGYIVGARPDRFYWWFTAQLMYFMPIRYYTYQKRGYHYFLADLCYFVNFLMLLSIWVFPRSKRLFLATYCLAYGNNAIAIVMWRNSLVFHSLDKVTSLFIHIMPPVALHCIVHLTSDAVQQARFPAVYNIRTSAVGDPEHYSLLGMLGWATVPYMIWQTTYHMLISVRRREKIAAGRPTSFTYLRKSYAKTWLGRLVLRQPESLQEPMFMLVQYSYAMCTVLPCPLWFWYRWPSALFLFVVFVWSIYNGATYYLDVFGKRFQNELEQLRRDVARWQASPDGPVAYGEDGMPLVTPGAESNGGGNGKLEQVPSLDADVGVAGVAAELWEKKEPEKSAQAKKDA